jgi:hypothetical protein
LLKTSRGKLSSLSQVEVILLLVIPTIGTPIDSATGALLFANTETAGVSAEAEGRQTLDGGKPVT